MTYCEAVKASIFGAPAWSIAIAWRILYHIFGLCTKIVQISRRNVLCSGKCLYTVQIKKPRLHARGRGSD